MLDDDAVGCLFVVGLVLLFFIFMIIITMIIY